MVPSLIIQQGATPDMVKNHISKVTQYKRIRSTGDGKTRNTRMIARRTAEWGNRQERTNVRVRSEDELTAGDVAEVCNAMSEHREYPIFYLTFTRALPTTPRFLAFSTHTLCQNSPPCTTQRTRCIASPSPPYPAYSY